MNETGLNSKAIITTAVTIAVGLALIVGLIIGGGFGCRAYGRYQARADANNHVKINRIRIRFFEQQRHIAQQQAQIRYAKSIGIRRAQDEISSTLTPLYVKFEMIDALNHIAQSGRNNTVIYIPTDASGMAAVPTIRAGSGK